MRSRLPRKVRERATDEQLQKLREQRDCPECSGILDRIEVLEDERIIIEDYTHKGGSRDCDGNDPDNGFWRAKGNMVFHYLDRTEGTGILRGEF